LSKKPDISQKIEVPIPIIKLANPNINRPLNNKINPAVTRVREELNKICGFIEIIYNIIF
tara:strand:- start:268 stop:447 length:180 start_codon:yes stop_codon:yes gene_type:complete